MNHYNPIYKQKSILETVCVMHVFIDGVVVVNGKNIYYVLLKHKHINRLGISDKFS